MSVAERILLGLAHLTILAVTIGILWTLLSARPNPEPQVYEDWRPPLHLCPTNVERWECMRHALYARKDI